MKDILGVIKEQLIHNVGFIYPIDFKREKDNVLFVFINNLAIFQIEVIDERTVRLSCEHRSPPSFAVMVYGICQHEVPDVELVNDFVVDREHGILPVSYHEPQDPNKMN